MYGKIIELINNRFMVCHSSGTITNRATGVVCSYKDHAGYIKVYCGMLNGKQKMMYGHQIVYLSYHGSLPEGSIDHIDRCRDNNAISNLRESTAILQQRNRIKGGVTLTYWNTWKARIQVNGKPVTKSFKTKQEALDWRKRKELELWKEE